MIFFVGQQFPADVSSKRITHVRHFLFPRRSLSSFFFLYEISLFRKSSRLMVAASREMERINSIFPHFLRSPNHTRTPGGQTCSCKILTDGFFGSCAAGRVLATRPSQNLFSKNSAARHYNMMSPQLPSLFSYWNFFNTSDFGKLLTGIMTIVL